jgi:hypothetical protein
VKKILFVVMLVTAFSFMAMAQGARVPSVVATHTPNVAHGNGGAWGLHLPSNATVIFYGGDTNTSDPNEQGFVNGNTLLTPTSPTYSSVTVPASAHVVATGIFYNSLPEEGAAQFDPATGTYDIRTGVSDQNGGTSLASGSGPQTAVATGRDPFGFPEYTTTVNFAKPLNAKGGVTYTVDESPQCTDESNGDCEAEFFYSNTTQETNGVNASAQPAGKLFLNSAFFGFTWENWCDSALGQNAEQCARGSFGILGSI